jgi:hypothetical protein
MALGVDGRALQSLLQNPVEHSTVMSCNSKKNSPKIRSARPGFALIADVRIQVFLFGFCVWVCVRESITLARMNIVSLLFKLQDRWLIDQSFLAIATFRCTHVQQAFIAARPKELRHTAPKIVVMNIAANDSEASEIPVCCGNLSAVLEVRSARIRYTSGDTVSRQVSLCQHLHGIFRGPQFHKRSQYHPWAASLCLSCLARHSCGPKVLSTFLHLISSIPEQM